MGHGGQRSGAGRKPKALRYAREVAAAEERIVAALPELVGLLLDAARKGDTAASRYLVDRVLGRVQTQSSPIAEDLSLPMEHPAAEALAAMRQRRSVAKELAVSAESVRAEELRIHDAEFEVETGITLGEASDLFESGKRYRPDKDSPASPTVVPDKAA